MNIIATIRRLGDKKDLYNRIQMLIANGVHDFRFNFAKSMNSPEKLKSILEDVLFVKNISKDIRIMADIPYPGSKWRLTGNFISYDVYKNTSYRLYTGDVSKSMYQSEVFYLNSPICNSILYDNENVYYNNGEGSFRVVKNSMLTDEVYLVAENDFTVYNMKSISFGEIQKKSYRRVLESICTCISPQQIALSFVEETKDVMDALNLQNSNSCEVICKIETEKGVQNAEEICNKVGGLLIGRGDLGLNSDIKRLLEYEERLSHICQAQNRKFYIATGILDSMCVNILPNRSDIIDLAIAIRLNPSGIILNVPLIFSEYAQRAIEFIRNMEVIY